MALSQITEELSATKTTVLSPVTENELTIQPTVSNSPRRTSASLLSLEESLVKKNYFAIMTY